MNLVIVESPAKGKTIEKYLGKGYKVQASFGHVRDLPKRDLGVDIEKNFKPKYIVPPKAKKVISNLKTLAKKSDIIYLATDYDREGEAIAWHIKEALGKDLAKKEFKRITFHEITKNAILEAVKNPRSLDDDLIDAQQARRVLDRLVGYKLSPFLWKKVMKGLSAGRVQSVATRLIVEREREIKKFAPQEYWSIIAILLDSGVELEASLIKWKSKKLDKLEIKNKEEADKILALLEGAVYKIESVESKEVQKHPYPPFTTSTLQQEASKKLHFSAKKTMKVAQDLYEAGHITYMRTDSMNLASEAVAAARQLIEGFGKDYLPASPKFYKTKSKGAQEAHEAIRPTDVGVGADDLVKMQSDHQRLYRLIWQRMVASQMNSARVKQLRIDIKANDGLFRATGSQLLFDGFLKVWPSQFKEKSLPSVKEGQELDLKELKSNQHFTEPPPRYSEATLVKALEEHGIGRPSTYAPTLSTIQSRGYVHLDSRRFHADEIGEIVTDVLVEHFPQIIDIDFTRDLEKDLDSIADGKREWVKVIGDFYEPFADNLEKKEKSVEKKKVEEATDELCPECSKSLVIKLGRFGKFYACTGFPDCRYTRAIKVSSGIKCEKCGEGEMLERHTRKGKVFWGCSRYPECDNATWNDPSKEKQERE